MARPAVGAVVSTRGHPVDGRPRTLAVNDGRRCVGFILPRGKTGFEAFDRDERSRGLFPTQQDANCRALHHWGRSMSARAQLPNRRAANSTERQ
jgi:hypothetical protein